MSLSLNDLPAPLKSADYSQANKDEIQKPWQTETQKRTHPTGVKNPTSQKRLRKQTHQSIDKLVEARRLKSDDSGLLNIPSLAANFTKGVIEIKNWLKSIEVQPQLKIPIPELLYYKKRDKKN